MKIMQRKYAARLIRSASVLVLFAVLIFPVLSSAQAICPDPNTDPNNADPQICVTDPTGGQTFQQILDRIILWLNRILIPVLMIILLIGAFQMLTARDNETQFKKGKTTVTYAIIGAAVVLVANGILLVIESFLRVH